ncbi:hypothetical protein GW17_00045257 [Ensete ventricosum]|nr:hypothetical protein GW17_00045257 [Ensete ventricosum]
MLIPVSLAVHRCLPTVNHETPSSLPRKLRSKNASPFPSSSKPKAVVAFFRLGFQGEDLDSEIAMTGSEAIATIRVSTDLVPPSGFGDGMESSRRMMRGAPLAFFGVAVGVSILRRDETLREMFLTRKRVEVKGALAQIHQGRWEKLRKSTKMKIVPDRPLPGGITSSGCFCPVTTRNWLITVDFKRCWPLWSVTVDFDRRRSISDNISRGREKKYLESTLLFARAFHRSRAKNRLYDSSRMGHFFSLCRENKRLPTWGEGTR